MGQDSVGGDPKKKTPRVLPLSKKSNFNVEKKICGGGDNEFKKSQNPSPPVRNPGQGIDSGFGPKG